MPIIKGVVDKIEIGERAIAIIKKARMTLTELKSNDLMLEMDLENLEMLWKTYIKLLESEY